MKHPSVIYITYLRDLGNVRSKDRRRFPAADAAEGWNTPAPEGTSSSTGARSGLAQSTETVGLGAPVGQPFGSPDNELPPVLCLRQHHPAAENR